MTPRQARLLSIFFLLSTVVFAVSTTENTACASGNTPTSRQCWSDGFDIDTNYYESWPDTGVIREYWLSVENHTLSLTGVEVAGVLAVNGTVPGPTLYGDWGDTFLIHVTNNLEVNGTSIHWHGIRQWMSNPYDGVPGVTQCPLPPGSTRTYRWLATQYGTSWYHSHFTVQYGAGLYGAIQINGPATTNYDIDLGVLTLGDWYTPLSPFSLLVGAADAEVFPVALGGIINGTNDLPCNSKNSTCVPSTLWETTVVKGKRYRLRLVNVAIQNYFRFTIDNHRFWVIQNDFVPVRPYNIDSIVLGEGQRYDIVFEADQEVDNYWLRVMYQDCAFPMIFPNRTLGIIRYEGADAEAKPTTTNYLLNDTFATACGSAGYFDTLEPWLSFDVGPPALIQEIDISLSAILGTNTFLINRTSFFVDWEYPTISALAAKQPTPYHDDESRPIRTNRTLIDEGYNLPDQYNGSLRAARNIIDISGAKVKKDTWVYFYMNNHITVPDWHPMHLHGHDFWVLSQGGGHWYPENGTVNTYNPPRRDVSILPEYGHLVIAFKVDNPGIWLMHCHIAWHVSEGLAWQFVESKEDITGMYDLKTVKEECDDWKAYVRSPGRVWGQDDSGV